MDASNGTAPAGLPVSINELSHRHVGTDIGDGEPAEGKYCGNRRRLQMRLLATIAEFERARIGERVRAGLAHARANGQRLGQKPQHIPAEALERTAHLSVRHAAAQLGISRSVLHRARLSRRPTEMGVKGTNETGHRSVPLSASRGELFEGRPTCRRARAS